MDKLSDRFVDGDGPKDAQIMVIGEAPGEQEDKLLKPFVGPAGKFLDMALEASELARNAMYVTNVVKYRPPGNRPPTDLEIRQGLTHLLSEIEEVKPDFVLLLGNTAFSTLTRYDGGITKRHGRVDLKGSVFPSHVIVFATIHPSAAMRSEAGKTMFYEDIAVFAKIIQGAYKQTECGAG